MRLKNALAIGGVLVLGLLVAASRYGRALPPAPPHARIAPELDKLPDWSACWLEFLRSQAPGMAGAAGFSSSGQWDVTVSGVLLRHSGGDILLDTGNSSHFKQELAGYPLLPKAFLMLGPGSNKRVMSPPDALRALGEDPAHLRVLLSHMHVDHAGGLMDLPPVPVLLSPAEAAYAWAMAGKKTIQVIPAHARAIEGRVEPLRFEPKPYETFDQSADLYGDGSVVAVPLPGHTPGSIGVFINLSPTRRAFHVGDAVDTLDALHRRVSKSFVMGVTDEDGPLADEQVARLAQLQRLDPDLQIIPAHDRTAWSAFFGAPGRCVSR